MFAYTESQAYSCKLAVGIRILPHGRVDEVERNANIGLRIHHMLLTEA